MEDPVLAKNPLLHTYYKRQGLERLHNIVFRGICWYSAVEHIFKSSPSCIMGAFECECFEECCRNTPFGFLNMFDVSYLQSIPSAYRL